VDVPVEVRWIKPDAVSPAAGLDVVTHRWPKVIGPIPMSYSPMIEKSKTMVERITTTTSTRYLL
jgi:hypothetical protein